MHLLRGCTITPPPLPRDVVTIAKQEPVPQVYTFLTVVTRPGGALSDAPLPLYLDA